MTVNFIPIFPELVFMCPVKPATGLLEHFDELRRSSPKEQRSVHGGWETPNNLHQDEYFYNRFLKDYFLPEFKKELYPINFPEFDIASLWISEVNRGGYHQSHCHPGADMAFIWYLKTSERNEDREGDISIENPRTYSSWNVMQNLKTACHPDTGQPLTTMYHIAPTFSVRPEAGLVLMFPGYLMHQVVQSQADSRIAMSGNLIFKKDQPQRVQEPYLNPEIVKETEQRMQNPMQNPFIKQVEQLQPQEKLLNPKGQDPTKPPRISPNSPWF